MATYWENSCSFGLRYVSWYKCLIVSLFFSHLGFWRGNLFLIALFPDLCLLVPFYVSVCTKLMKRSCTIEFIKISEYKKCFRLLLFPIHVLVLLVNELWLFITINYDL